MKFSVEESVKGCSPSIIGCSMICLMEVGRSASPGPREPRSRVAIVLALYRRRAHFLFEL